MTQYFSDFIPNTNMKFDFFATNFNSKIYFFNFFQDSNRASRDSQSSLILQSVVASTAVAQLPLEDGCLSFQSADSGHNSVFSSTGHVVMREIKTDENKQHLSHRFEQQSNNSFEVGN